MLTRTPTPSAPPSTGLRGAQKALTRDLLTAAAERVFARRGYVDATVDEIAREAGASRATFYLHFEGKPDVLRAAMRRLQQTPEYQHVLAGFKAIRRPTPKALEAWLDSYVDFYLLHPDLHTAIHQAQAVDPAFIRGRLDELDDYVRLFESLGFASNREDARVAALLFFGCTDATLHLWLANGYPADRTRVVGALARSLAAAFR